MSRLLLPAWLRDYRRQWLREDLVAGTTAAAVVIPKAMACAAIAGLSVGAGLYTALAAMLIYPLLGTSRPLSVSTTSAIAMLTAASVGAAAPHAMGASPATIVATLALLVGATLIAARILRLGFLANFVSAPVLVGFEAGVGAAILVSQLKALLGVPLVSHTTLGTLVELPGVVSQIHGPTVLVATVGVVLLVVLPRLIPKVPASLVWVSLSAMAALFFDLEAHGVRSVGSVPTGLPAVVLPGLQLVGLLWPSALGIALMSFTESVAAARTFSRRGDAPLDANRELLAIGVANAAVSAVGGLPAGGGASQTAVVDGAGAHSQMAQWVGAGVVLLSLLVLSPYIGLLPQPALAAVVVVACASMIKPEAFRAIARVRRMEFAWALATVASVLVFGTLQGILVAVAISILAIFYQASHPPVYAVAWNRAQGLFRRAGENPSDETLPGLLILRTEGRLSFVNAANTAARMRALVDEANPRVLVLECGAIPDLEYTALLMLTEAERNLRARGVTLWLAGINPDLKRIIERAPLGAALGPERIFHNLAQALEAWRKEARAVVST